MTRCACGLPLHYADPTIEAFVQRAVDRLGPDVLVPTPTGPQWVSRHFYVLHMKEFGGGEVNADLQRVRADLQRLAETLSAERSIRGDDDHNQ